MTNNAAVEADMRPRIRTDGSEFLYIIKPLAFCEGNNFDGGQSCSRANAVAPLTDQGVLENRFVEIQAGVLLSDTAFQTWTESNRIGSTEIFPRWRKLKTA